MINTSGHLSALAVPITSLFTCLLFLAYNGQSQNPYFTNFNVNNGLPSSEVYDVEIAANGKLWFATDRGVCRYDGYEFKTFTTRDGLADNTIIQIIPSPTGRLWLVGIGGKLSYIESDRIIPFSHNAQLLKYIKETKRRHRSNGSLWVAGLAWDSEGDMYLWPSRRPFISCIFQLDSNKELFQKYEIDKLRNCFPTLEIDDMLYYDAGTCIIPDSNVCADHYAVRKGKDVFLTYAFDGTLHRYSFDDQQQQYVETATIFIAPMIDCLFFDAYGNLLVGTSQGLFLYPQGDLANEPERYFKELTITNVIQDAEKHYWITSLEKGIFQVPSFSIKSLPKFKSLHDEEKILSLQTWREQLLMGSSAGKLLAIHPNLQQELLIQDERLRGKLWNIHLKNSILCVGPNTIDLVSNRTIDEKSDHFGKHLFKLANGHLLSHGLNNFIIYDSLKEKVIVPKSKIDDRTICVLEKDSLIWVGSSKGLYTIANYDYLNPQIADIPILQNARINDLKIDKRDNMWIATVGEGLCYYTTDTLFQLTEPQINSNMINRILLENDTTLWIATNRGLNRIHYTTSPQFSVTKTDQLGTQDGLLSNFINDIQTWNGYVFVATDDWINYFLPDHFLQKTYPIPTISLDQVSINNQALDKSSHPQVFSHDQNNIHFQFTGISYQHSNKHTFYRYRLYDPESADSSWIYTNDRNARYNDLPDGKYVFEAAARNRQGEWSVEPVRYEFQILPHFSQTLVFQLAMLLGLGGFIHWLYQLRNKREKIQQAQQQRIATAELKTKQAELLTLRNQMNPHFIYNVLNSIQNFIVRQDIFQANEYLSNFSKLIRNSLRFSRLQYISIAEEIDFLENYLSLEKMRFPHLFSYNIHLPEELSVHYWHLPALLIQPLVENAVKHAFKEVDHHGEINIQFHINAPEKFIRIYIIDNGVGINESRENRKNISSHQSLGLDIIRQQIDIINYQIDTELASLTISDQSQKQPQKTGTIATLTLPIYHGYSP